MNADPMWNDILHMASAEYRVPRAQDASSNPTTLSLLVYDLPRSQGQVHLHADSQGNLVCGSVYSYDRSAVYMLDGYRAAMADAHLRSLGFTPKHL